MINLLGQNDKKQLRAARRNTVWVRYTMMVLASLITMNLVSFGTVWVLSQQEAASNEAIENERIGQGVEYVKAKREIEAFRDNLVAAKVILGGETSYSDVILDIAHILPKNTALSSLTLNPQAFGVPQNFSFKVKTNEDAVALKTALENSDGLFSNVSIVSISGSEGSSDSYPVLVAISAVLKKPTTAPVVAASGAGQ